MFRIGIGFDAHRFSENRKLMLGGVHIEFEPGLEGHSDADVLLHALADALLGAAGLGDLGEHFPDSDPAWKDVESKVFVRNILEELTSLRWSIVNVDVTIIAQAPKIAPHRSSIRESVSTILEVPEDAVNIKATTTDHMGFLGRGEGIAAQAVVLLKTIDDAS